MNKIDIQEIQDYIDDAFNDTWSEIGGELDGLFGFIREYNECFMTDKDNSERAAHVILFAKKAIEEGHRLTKDIQKECRKEIEYLASNNISILKKEVEFLKDKI